MRISPAARLIAVFIPLSPAFAQAPAPGTPSSSPAAEPAWTDSFESARTEAARDGKPQLLLFTDDGKRSEGLLRAFAEADLRAYGGRLIYVRLPYATGSPWAGMYDVDKAPAVVLLGANGKRIAASTSLGDAAGIRGFLTKNLDTAYLISSPTGIMVYLMGIVAAIYLISLWKPLETFFNYVPALTWCYFLPMLGTSIGITPDQSEACEWFSDHALPLLVILLLMSCDLRGIARLGPKAVALALIGTVGIFIGALVSFAVVLALAKAVGNPLPEEAWKGVAALSGSWTGGSSNMAAIAKILDAPPTVISPLIIVDTVVAYSWMGVMIWMAGFQFRYDRWLGADASVVIELERRMKSIFDVHRRPITATDFGIMMGFAFVVSELCMESTKAWVPPWQMEQVHEGVAVQVTLLSKYGWGMLAVTAAGILLSFTPAQKLEYAGASSIGSMLLYLFLATFGLKADLRSIFTAPLWMLLGVLWLLIHLVILYAASYLLKAPLFLFSIASMANVGGTASCPVLATAYNRSLAPVGLLMAILCGLYANPFGILVARICHWIQHG